ncbi:MAG: T9SS type A sorting domain-containing protein [Ignavibacteriota bacterium]|jgi:hypothetical protein|nr:MAG: T9SS C-terminal target domain-containing protein [Chlorobiota bacterium]MBE7476220.1 T9SS type A sorting domain-containing protein [Ignavibacteriales bacterium]MBL1124501.1 T9SS C-terminal target domain-containing protein [Ignavibacteriota bacterium]MEB2297974.1 T9SS type A sorting domain-containing protein [Ignavibacteria bacterium]GJQ43472.1 MAG: hypothetical protein JETCAE03_29700 [Ignavibacteriaceae bacterium]
MKTWVKLFSILICVVQINLFSQIPNSGFENWVGGDPSIPEGWITNNAPPAYTPVIRTTDAYMGSYAVQIWNVYFGTFVISPFMYTDKFPVTQAHGSLSGYYEFYPFTGNESIYVTTWFTQAGVIVGGGGIDIGTGASTYTMFNFDIAYTPGANPDSAYIYIGMVDTTGVPQVGAYAYIDELAFGPPSDVQEISSSVPDNFNLSQNYPNPFNPSTKIEYSITEASFVQLKVYDILGNEVAELVNEEQTAGTYRADFSGENLSSGLYIAKLQADNFTKTIKMSLLK